MPSINLSSDFKVAIENNVMALLTRRAAVREPLRISPKQLEAMTFKDEGDYKLMVDFRQRFASQFKEHSPIRLDYTAHISAEIHLKWRIHIYGVNLCIEEGDTQTLHYDRDPVVHDRFMDWVKAHENVVLERWLGEWLVGEALQHVGTTSQLNWLWPQLLKLDRSGKFQSLSERSRPKDKPPRTRWRDNWMATVSQWLAEGAIMGNLRTDQQTIGGTVNIREGSIAIQRDSVMSSIAANLRSLHIDADGKRLPKYGDW